MTESAFTRHLPDEAATLRLGAALSARWKPGLCVFLRGDLGAGKSALARAAIQSALAREGRHEDVPSPTFTLIQEYVVDGLRVAHCDLYRLSEPEEALELGLEEIFAEGVALIEWPDRLADLAPAERLEITLAIPPSGVGRTLTLAGAGARALAEEIP